MSSFIYDSIPVTEENMCEALSELTRSVIGLVTNSVYRDICFTVCDVSKVNTNEIKNIISDEFWYNLFSMSNASLISDNAKMRIVLDTLAVSICNLVSTSRSTVDFSNITPQDKTVSNQGVATLAKSLQRGGTTNGLTLSSSEVSSALNISLAVKYWLDVFKLLFGVESTIDSDDTNIEKYKTILSKLLNQEPCAFYSNISFGHIELDSKEDCIQQLVLVVSACLMKNSYYTTNKLVVLRRSLNGIPVEVKGITFSMLSEELKGYFFESGEKTGESAIKVAILIVDALLSKPSNYLDQFKIMSM